MTEIITTTVSSPSEMEAKGMQVLYRCKDCNWAGWNFYQDAECDYCVVHCDPGGYALRIDPEGYCSWATPKI